MRQRPSVLAMLTYLPVSLASVAALGGCYDDGHDYAVTSTWLLNAATPDATRCKELGIATFRLTMEGPRRTSSLEGDCTDTLYIAGASYGGFETSRSFDYGVSYLYTVDALDAKGKALYGYESEITAYPGDFVPVDLDVVDVFEPSGKIASLSAEWVFTNGDLATDCNTNKIETVEIWVASATDPDFEDAFVLSSSACDAGTFISKGKILARGDYLFKYVALDGRPAFAEASEAISQYIDEPGDLALPRHQFKGL